MPQLTRQRSAADAAVGEPEEFSVHENYWVREETADGRTYFFNRATGASQWHVPDDQYNSRVPKVQLNKYREDLIRFPASSKAGMKVDCVMEVPSQNFGPSESEILEEQRRAQEEADRKRKEEEDDWARNNPIVLRHPHLTLHIISAKGLRDTDFMPGKDKSDPYCLVQVLGKTIAVKTHVVQDQLDPTWDFEVAVQGYDDKDSLEFSVWDADEIRPLTGGSATFNAVVDDGDDLLGRIILTPEMIHEMTGPQTFELEETGEEPAFLTIWPEVTYTEEYLDPRENFSAWKEGGGEALDSLAKLGA